MKGIFITGTDTNVGKTHIATQLARALTQKNVRVIPRKPVETGCTRTGNELLPADALALKTAANYSGSLQQVCLYRFEPAISPALAARQVNKKLCVHDLTSACLSGVTENDFLLVEGAGGFYSPAVAALRLNRHSVHHCTVVNKIRRHLLPVKNHFQLRQTSTPMLNRVRTAFY